MRRNAKPKVGDVVEIALPSGGSAYGRVLKDASIAIYGVTSAAPGHAPVGDRDYQFVVGIYEDALRGLPVVARDESLSEDDEWPPPFGVTDAISGEKRIYHRAAMRSASSPEVDDLEPAAVWELEHIVDRIESSCENA